MTGDVATLHELDGIAGKFIDHAKGVTCKVTAARIGLEVPSNYGQL